MRSLKRLGEKQRIFLEGVIIMKDDETIKALESEILERDNIIQDQKIKIDQLFNIINTIPGSVYWKDLTGRYLGCNDYQKNMNGGRDLIGLKDNELPWAEKVAEIRKNDDAVISTGAILEFEEHPILASGERITTLTRKAPLYNKDKDIIGVLGISLDISGREKSIQNIIREKNVLKEEKEFIESTLSNIVADMPGHVYWKNREGVYLGCNDRQAKSLGFNSGKGVIGKTDFDLSWGSSIAENFRENDLLVMNTQCMHTVEEDTTIDGVKRTMLSQKTPLKDNKGNIVGVLGISIEITRLKNIQEELVRAKEKAEAANKAKTEFVQNMQHDIRTPCAGLWGVLNILAKAEEDHNKKEALDMAAAASKKLLELCNEAVEFGDLSSNVRPVLEKALNIRELAESIVELNKPAAFAKDLLIHFKVDASIPAQILCDEFRLSRILVNLMGNALKFTNKGEVALNLKAEVDKETHRGWLTLEIKDTGIGIPADKIKTIYEKFSRAVASNTNLYPGTGLGLYVVKTFVDELNGNIELESRENEGTSFKVGIPFKVRWEDMKKPGVEIDEYFRSPIDLTAEVTQNPEAIFQKTSLAKKPFTHTLLIIEDDKTCLFAEKNLLSTYTNQIDVAENVAEALEKLATKRYDLVISDLGLPDGSGNDIVAKVKATPESANYNTPFVAMTAHQDALKHQQAMKAGFTATHIKPLGAEKAVELLKSYPAQESGISPQEVIISPKVEGKPVIDLALGRQRIAANNEEQAIEALGVLWETLQIDIPLLQLAAENNDLAGANAILLKIRGGLYYTGTPRLEEACEVLHTEVGRGVKDLRKIHSLFSAFYDEAKLFAEQFKELVKGVNAQKEAEHLRMVNEKQKALLEQEAKFTQIANQVAHDIRSPLATLSMIVESCTHIPETQRLALREAAIGIEDIANHLLHEYKKKGSDEVTEHEACHPLLVSAALLESLTHKKYQYDKCPIQFDCTMALNAQFAFIKIQASAFKRMLSNLMNNAVDALEGQPGTIHLHLEADTESVKVHIQDSGKGMPADVADKILHKIAITQGKKLGHGLGFTQVREALEHNQGELEIDSKLGVGTTITLSFPRTSAPQWVAQEIVLNPDDTLIILDDDSSIHGAWDTRFEPLLNKNPELQLKHFQFGRETLAFIQRLTPAEKEHIFLLSDYELLNQEYNGLTIIAKSGIQRSILVTSHYADPEVQAEAVKAGTKILPKQLAAEVVIKINDRDEVTSEKVYAVLVDDHPGFTKALALYAFDDDQITAEYNNPEHLLRDLDKYAKNTKIYLDNNYATSKLTGIEVAKKLHEQGYTHLYILSGESALEAPSYVTVIGKNEIERIKDL
ncbi:MAG: Histidine kinase [Gammaproteobacteria bacterium]|jgi:signal transduction histidine kinase|nr:Histidine kinase [Gammaproteobacteria bacterium]